MAILGLSQEPAAAHTTQGVPGHSWDLLVAEMAAVPPYFDSMVIVNFPQQVYAVDRTAGVDTERVAARIDLWVVRGGQWKKFSSPWYYTSADDIHGVLFAWQDASGNSPSDHRFTNLVPGERYYVDTGLYWYSRGISHWDRRGFTF